MEADESAREAQSDEFPTSVVRRRLDGLLAPRFVTVWVDEELEEISDPDTIGLLGEPYSDKSDGGRDWNLVSERWVAADAQHPIANWEAVVRKATVEARQRVLTDASLAKACQRAQRDLADAKAKTVAQLVARIERLDGQARVSEEDHLRRERCFASFMHTAVGNPVGRLDSMGAVFLSGDPLTGQVDE